MNFKEVQTADRRLVLLRLLAESGEYRAAVYLLQTAAEGFGHAASLDCIKTDVAWLAEQGLVESETVGGVVIATLTQRGADVSAGRVTVPGVKRPMPGA